MAPSSAAPAPAFKGSVLVLKAVPNFSVKVRRARFALALPAIGPRSVLLQSVAPPVVVILVVRLLVGVPAATALFVTFRVVMAPVLGVTVTLAVMDAAEPTLRRALTKRYSRETLDAAGGTLGTSRKVCLVLLLLPFGVTPW